MMPPTTDDEDDREPREFKDGHYGCKFMSADDKRTIYFARKRAKMQAGEYIGLAVREKVMREREPIGTSMRTIDGLPPLSADDIYKLVESLERLVAMRGEPLSKAYTRQIALRIAQTAGVAVRTPFRAPAKPKPPLVTNEDQADRPNGLARRPLEASPDPAG